MLAAVLSAVNQLSLTEIPTPAPRPGEVLVNVGATTICGTDRRILRGEKTKFVSMPVVLGHESAGEVSAVGEGVTTFSPGDRVALLPSLPDGACWACRHGYENLCEHPDKRIFGYSLDGGLAERMLIPARAIGGGYLFKTQSDLSYEALALAEPLGAVVNGQHQTPVSVGDTVLIMGAGPIGLLHLQLALLSGARQVIVSQRSPQRRELAQALGATTTVDPTTGDLPRVVAQATDGRGVDLTIICIGVAELVNEALQLTRVAGKVNIFAGLAGDGWARVQANLIHYKQLLVTGSSEIRRTDFESALQLITSEQIDTAALITHRFPLSAVHEAT
jgi:L-iditol 2-dehydrogenase